jgi:hypothetical protein
MTSSVVLMAQGVSLLSGTLDGGATQSASGRAGARAGRRLVCRVQVECFTRDEAGRGWRFGC